MRKLILTSLLALSIVANAQFGISVRGGALLSENTDLIGSFNNLITVSPELGFNYSFKKLSVNMGVGLNTLGDVNLNGKVISGDPVMPSITDERTYSYLSIPLFLAYQITIGKLFIAPQVGLSSNILTNASWSVELNGETQSLYHDYLGDETLSSSKIQTNKIQTATSFIPSVLGGVSIGYNITEHFGIDLSGRYNYALSEYDTRYTGKINSTAILLGINYKF